MTVAAGPAPLEILSADEAGRALSALVGALQRGELPLAVKPEVAAKMLDISQRTLERLPIPSVKLGHRTRRYPVRALMAYLEEHAA